ncbi:uncharacterized protein [Miscanthus floridulus]|uniref:uncharacterized protein n=1 Tax=Miscanthus floridulus TaxID=154761 RepID=UPI003458F921
MANHGAAALLLIASLLVAVALSGADARLSAVRHNAAAALRARLTVRRDAHGGYVLVAKAAPVPELTCTEVHGVQAGETCFSVGQGAGLTQEQFLGFNPNINCEKIFVGQWVCLQATSA